MPESGSSRGTRLCRPARITQLEMTRQDARGEAGQRADGRDTQVSHQDVTQIQQRAVELQDEGAGQA